MQMRVSVPHANSRFSHFTRMRIGGLDSHIHNKCAHIALLSLFVDKKISCKLHMHMHICMHTCKQNVKGQLIVRLQAVAKLDFISI